MNEHDAKVIDYLKHCVSENLNHARHVENERLTFTSIYIAMVIGAVAVVFGLDDRRIAMLVSLVLALFGLMAMMLNMRWQGVFDDHIHMAEDCQKRWYAGLLNTEKLELPNIGYYYKSYNKTSGPVCALRRLLGASVWDLNQTAEEKARKKAEKQEEKARQKHPFLWKMGCFLKEIARTRRLFALLYLFIFIALVILTIYLATDKSNGGFYFTDEVITKLEEALNRIVEETKK